MKRQEDEIEIKDHYSLINRIKNYLKRKNNIDISPDSIFGHAFLDFIGYELIPENCKLIYKGGEKIFIGLDSPYGVEGSVFQDSLSECYRKLLSGSSVIVSALWSNLPLEEIAIQNQNFWRRLKNKPDTIQIKKNESEFVVCLVVDCQLLKDYWAYIQDNIDFLTSSPQRLECYKYPSEKGETSVVKIKDIENKVYKLVRKFPELSKDDIWNYLLDYESGQRGLTVSTKNVKTAIEHWPEIDVNCKNNEGKEQTITIYRHRLLKSLDDKEFLLICSLEVLKSYSRKEEWQKLKERLFTFLDLPTNHAQCALDLFEYAKGQRSNKLIEIAEDGLNSITKNKEKYGVERVAKAHVALGELSLMRIQTLSMENMGTLNHTEALREKTFVDFCRAKDPVCNLLFLELAGLPMGEALPKNIGEDFPEDVYLMFAKMIKALVVENQALKQKNESLEQPSNSLVGEGNGSSTARQENSTRLFRR